MKSFFRPLSLSICLLALVASGCVTAQSGLSGNIMYNTGLADIAVAPISGMVPMASGSYIDKMPSDAAVDPSIKINYSIFGDMNSQSVRRYGHVIIAELANKKAFEMKAETFPESNELSLRGIQIDRRDWTEHVFYERRQGDWFTEFWDMNGFITPQVWLGKRWSRSYDLSSRIVVEYREPMPPCARVQDKHLMIVLNDVTIDMPTPECRRDVEAVLLRADQAFSMRRPANVNITMPAPAEALTAKPDRKLDLLRYVGEAVYMGKATSDD